MPPAIVYKTTKDYSKYVPVTLSKDRTQIVAYPAPQDVYFEGKLAYPTPLKNGYWLDNRGINDYTAFLDITYEEYSKMKKAPSLKKMYKSIKDKNPIQEIYHLGDNRDLSHLNNIIARGELKNHK